MNPQRVRTLHSGRPPCRRSPPQELDSPAGAFWIHQEVFLFFSQTVLSFGFQGFVPPRTPYSLHSLVCDCWLSVLSHLVLVSINHLPAVGTQPVSSPRCQILTSSSRFYSLPDVVQLLKFVILSVIIHTNSRFPFSCLLLVQQNKHEALDYIRLD